MVSSAPVDAVGALHHPGPAGHAQAGRRARCGRQVIDGRSSSSMPASGCSTCARRHGARHHRDDDDGGDWSVRWRATGGDRAPQCRRRRVSGRLSPLGTHPVLRRGPARPSPSGLSGSRSGATIVAAWWLTVLVAMPGEAVVSLPCPRANAVMMPSPSGWRAAAAAHHVGVYVPDASVANFKQSSSRCRPASSTWRSGCSTTGAAPRCGRGRRPPAGRRRRRVAIGAGDVPAAERWLMVLFRARRDLAREADRRLADRAVRQAREAVGEDIRPSRATIA